MKRLFTETLSLLVVVTLLVGCGKTEEHKTDGKTIEGSLDTTLEKIQEPLNLEIMTFIDPIDLADKDSVKYNLGLDSNKGLKEAYVSNAMISSQAYSVAIIKVEAGADPHALAKDMVKNVDPMKWICVSANDISAAVYGDIILLVMVDTGLDQKGSQEYFKSLEDLVGESVDATYKQ